MIKRGPNDLDEIIDRLKKENKRLKKVYLKFCMKEQDDSNNCKYSVCRSYSYCCDLHCNLFNVL